MFLIFLSPKKREVRLVIPLEKAVENPHKTQTTYILEPKAAISLPEGRKKETIKTINVKEVASKKVETI